VNGDIRYIAMQVSGLEALQGAGLTDSGLILLSRPRQRLTSLSARELD